MNNTSVILNPYVIYTENNIQRQKKCPITTMTTTMMTARMMVKKKQTVTTTKKRMERKIVLCECTYNKTQQIGNGQHC